MEMKCSQCGEYIMTTSNNRDDIPDDIYRCPVCTIPMAIISEEISITSDGEDY